MTVEIPVTLDVVPRDDGEPGAILRIHGYPEVHALAVADDVGLAVSDELARICERRA